MPQPRVLSYCKAMVPSTPRANIAGCKQKHTAVRRYGQLALPYAACRPFSFKLIRMIKNNQMLASENANGIEYPLCRDWELQDNLEDLCAEDIQNAWWRGDCWEGTYGIAETPDGVYSARIEYRTNATIAATILDPDGIGIGWGEFDIDDSYGAGDAFRDMCRWIDGKLDGIGNEQEPTNQLY